MNNPLLTTELIKRLQVLITKLNFSHKTEEIIAIFKELTYPWLNISIEEMKKKNSVFTNDSSPIEFSVAVCDGMPELRFSMEVIENDFSITGKRTTALLFTEKLKKIFNLNLDQFNAVKDLFLPETMQGKFAMFHSVCFSADGSPVVKLYLNPNIFGMTQALPTIKLALKRLGFHQTIDTLCQILQRGENLDRVAYFSLDLGNSSNRVKVYCYHKDATIHDITKISSLAKTYVTDEHENFLYHMTGDIKTFSKWDLLTCTAFTERDYCQAQTITIYAPMFAYASHDEEAYHRIINYLETNHLSANTYREIIGGFKNRELSAGSGMQNCISLQRRADNKLRWTIYLATESMKIFKPGELPCQRGNI